MAKIKAISRKGMREKNSARSYDFVLNVDKYSRAMLFCWGGEAKSEHKF